VGVIVAVQVMPGHPQGVGVSVRVGVSVGVQVTPPEAMQGTGVTLETEPELFQVASSKYAKQ
jgi:hypothetical protein